MIRYEQKVIIVQCDGCSASCNTALTSFHQAMNYVTREEGWERRRLRGQWFHYCPQCGEYAQPELDQAGVYFGRKTIDD
jgi:hypothetical protein